MGSTEHRVAGLCEVTVANSNVRPKFRGLGTFQGGCQNLISVPPLKLIITWEGE